MKVEMLAPGLWRWSAGEMWCVYYEAPGAIVLIDPVVPEDEEERFWTALDRDVARLGLPVAIVLTADLDAGPFVSRYGASVWSATSS
jgi:glyoxylase-like metal-dependent hydrolase (beta-lactamase superfamily II)